LKISSPLGRVKSILKGRQSMKNINKTPFYFLTLSIVLLGCGVKSSENYPNLAEGFDATRLPLEREAPTILKKIKVINSSLPDETLDVLVRFENQKKAYQDSLEMFNQAEKVSAQRFWYSAQLEFTKLSRISVELEKMFRGGNPAGDFINSTSFQKNTEIENFLSLNLKKLFQLKP